MPEEKRERTVADIEKTFYETMSANSTFSSLKRSASALEELAGNTEALTQELKNASASSSALAKSLNKLTLAAVVIAALALGLELWKLYTGP